MAFVAGKNGQVVPRAPPSTAVQIVSLDIVCKGFSVISLYYFLYDGHGHVAFMALIRNPLYLVVYHQL